MKQLSLNKTLSILLTMILTAYALLIFHNMHRNSKTDMDIFYRSARLINAHLKPYHFDPNIEGKPTYYRGKTIHNLSPPFTSFIAAPIVKHVSSSVFYAMTITASLLFYLATLWLVSQHFFSPYRKSVFLITANMTLLSTSISSNIYVGELGFLIAGFAMLSYHLFITKKPILCAAVIGLACNIKLFFGIFFIYFLAMKQPRAFLSLAFFSLLFAIVPIWFCGVACYLGYLHALKEINWYTATGNASVFGFFCRLFGFPNSISQPLFELPWLTHLLYYASFLAGIFTLWKVSRADISNNSPALSFSLTLVLMLFLSPLGWSYYAGLLTIPFFTLLSHHVHPTMKTTSHWGLGFSFITFCIPMHYYSVHKYNHINQLTRSSLCFYGLTVLYLLLLSRSRKEIPSIEKAITIGNNKKHLFFLLKILLLTQFIFYFLAMEDTGENLQPLSLDSLQHNTENTHLQEFHPKVMNS